MTATARKRSAPVSEVIKAAMLADGRSIYRLAADTGIDRSTLRRFLLGADLGAGNIDKLATALRLSLRPDKGGS